MELAWKVMIPCGLVNFVAVAVWMEFGHGTSLAGTSGAMGPGGGRMAGAAAFVACGYDTRSDSETFRQSHRCCWRMT